MNDKGSIIYATTLLAPTFLIEKYRDLHPQRDSETLAGHSTFVTRFAKMSEDKRREIIVCCMPAETMVSTNYFNRKRDAAVDENGLFSTMLCASTIEKIIKNSDECIASSLSSNH